jgi:molecular chaperone DnaJ
VPIETAALGGEIQIPTIDGYAKLKVAPGTQSGKVYRLRGKGIPNVEGYDRGDLHVRVVVEVPVKLGGKQKKLFKELRELQSDGNYRERQAFRKRADAFYERKSAMGK